MIEILCAVLMIFQPEFKWSDHSCTQQGTGSFVKTSTGDTIGLTSAHFIDFSGPQLLKVEWRDIKTNKIVATSQKTWGEPGHEGCYNPPDLRSDYILMVIESDIPSQYILELDQRNLAENGERVWFPNKNPKAQQGYDLIGGSICEVKKTHLVVLLDQPIDLQSRSGTPILSQSTGKVIGILTAGGYETNRTRLYLTPSLSIYKALSEAKGCHMLQDVVGQKK